MGLRRHISRIGVAAFASLLALSALGTRAQTGPIDGEPFTQDEQARLRAGELVRRPARRREGGYSYIGGTSWQRIPARREDVWREILEVENYTDLIPGVEEARWVVNRGEERVVYLRHRYSFVNAAYHANVRIDRATWTIRFDLDRSRPADIRDGRGFITVDRYRGRESIVTWGVMADVGSGIITGVFAGVIYDWILRVPFCVRGHMSGRPTC